MTLINIDSVQFYPPLATADLRSDGRPIVSNLHVPTAYGKGNKLTAPRLCQKASKSL